MRRDATSALIPLPRVPLDENIAGDIRAGTDVTGLSETFKEQLTKQGAFTSTKSGKCTLYAPLRFRGR